MAKVLRNGKFKNPDQWKTKVICKITDEGTQKKEYYGDCKAIIEVGKDDIQRGHWKSPLGIDRYCSVTTCPQCGKLIDVKNVPLAVFQLIPKDKIVETGFDDSI